MIFIYIRDKTSIGQPWVDVCRVSKSSPLVGQRGITGFSFFITRTEKFCKAKSQIGFVAKSALICICSIHNWHYKDPTDSDRPNATECKTLSRPFSFFPFSHHPRFIVTAVWQTVSKHQIHCVLLCGVNNTESSTRPQSINHDRGTSNSTAAATFITKTCTRLFQPTSPLPTAMLSPLFRCFPSLHICHCKRNHMRIHT